MASTQLTDLIEEVISCDSHDFFSNSIVINSKVRLLRSPIQQEKLSIFALFESQKFCLEGEFESNLKFSSNVNDIIMKYRYSPIQDNQPIGYASLNICLVLHPQRIDESILSVLQEKFGDSMSMQRADLKEFEAAFRFACPKFLSPVVTIVEPDMSGETPVRIDPWNQQLRLYTKMPMSKLTAFLEIDEDTLRVDSSCSS
uniref:Uncharacterized protein n=1 Tax=Tetranychus urticae TaxID=32264 RepID=T1KTC6_TETUR